MKVRKDYRPDRIELRSERVRNIIGRIPPALVWWSVAIIMFVLVILVLVVFLVPYPYGGGESIFHYLFFG